MKLQYTPTLATDLKNSSVFIDSTALIHASKSDEFLNLLTSIAEAGCVFYTIPSVVYEYTRTSNTIPGHNERREFIKVLGVNVLNRVEEMLEEHRVFLVAYSNAFKDNKKPSYTDSLLCAMAYKHRSLEPYIMTANHKDIPSSMFDRTELITIDVKGELPTEALYKFSEAKFSTALKKLEKSS